MRVDLPALLFDQSGTSQAVGAVLDGDCALPNPAHGTLNISKLLYYPQVRVVCIQQAVLESEIGNEVGVVHDVAGIKYKYQIK